MERQSYKTALEKGCGRNTVATNAVFVGRASPLAYGGTGILPVIFPPWAGHRRGGSVPKGVAQGASGDARPTPRSNPPPYADRTLEKAKDLQKKLGSVESKALLIDAYIARIQGMLAKDLTAEAKALTDLVAARFPEAAGRLAGLQRGLAAQTGDVAALVAPLADPSLAPQRRAEAEQAIRQELVDLAALAATVALPEGHPLRVAAADLARAFAAVTSGPVDEATIEWPASRTAAPWRRGRP